MRKLLTPTAVIAFVIFFHSALAQAKPEDIITLAEVERIEKRLASDDMQGRKTGTPGIEKAAAFIEQEFKTAGLQPMKGLSGYRQEFTMVQPKHISTAAKINGADCDNGNVIVITHQPEVNVSEASAFEKVYIKSGQNLFQEARKYVGAKKNMIIIVDTSFKKIFSRLTGYRRLAFPSDVTQVFILSENDPSTFSITSRHNISQVKMANVIGVLPGKSKSDESVIFSAHYDHLGFDKPTTEGDSLYNGANDNASGTTAVVMLAKYFGSLNNNERSIMFVAFTAEEQGLIGSQYFGTQIEPSKVAAMFNIEMIGTESKWGKHSVYVTGHDKSDMATILQKSAETIGFSFHPDPYPQQDLFLRSDNASLARLGVPAHTFSSSKMDVEKFYHHADDEVETLDLANMTAIIRAFAVSASGIVSGKDTPSRVKN